MLTFLVTWSTLGSISNIFNVLKHFFYKSNCNKYCKDIVWFLSLKGNKIQAQKIQYNKFVESGLENYSLISWITIIVNPDDKKTKINWFYPKKIAIGSIREDQFLYIFFFEFDNKSSSCCYSIFLSIFRSSLFRAFFLPCTLLFL